MYVSSSVRPCPETQVWHPCWNGCNPEVVICGEPYDIACEVADPAPCIARCVCEPEQSEIIYFMREDGRCDYDIDYCDCK